MELGHHTDGLLDFVLDAITALGIETQDVHAVAHHIAVALAIPEHEFVGLALHVLGGRQRGGVELLPPTVEELGVELHDGLRRDAVGVVDAVVVGRETIGTNQLRLADDDVDGLALILDGVAIEREGDIELDAVAPRLRNCQDCPHCR